MAESVRSTSGRIPLCCVLDEHLRHQRMDNLDEVPRSTSYIKVRSDSLDQHKPLDVIVLCTLYELLIGLLRPQGV